MKKKNPFVVTYVNQETTTLTALKESYKGRKVKAPIGKSIVSVLNGNAQTAHENDGMGWELFEMKSYIKGNWKILRLPQPFGSGQWQLIDLSKDPAEINDLSAQFPDKKAELVAEWNAYAKANEVFDHHGLPQRVRRHGVPDQRALPLILDDIRLGATCIGGLVCDRYGYCFVSHFIRLLRSPHLRSGSHRTHLRAPGRVRLSAHHPDRHKPACRAQGSYKRR